MGLREHARMTDILHGLRGAPDGLDAIGAWNAVMGVGLCFRASAFTAEEYSVKCETEKQVFRREYLTGNSCIPSFISLYMYIHMCTRTYLHIYYTYGQVKISCINQNLMKSRWWTTEQ